MLQDDLEIERPDQSLSVTPITFASPSPDPVHILHLYGRLNYYAQIRLGYAEAISVLYRHLQDLPNRPSGINFSSFILSSDIASLPENFQLLVDALGLETSVSVLENASIHDGAITHDLGGSSGGTGMDDILVDNSREPSVELFPRAPVPVGAASRTSPHGTPTNRDRQNRRQRRPGRGGALRCKQCRRAKRGLQVVSLKPCINRKCNIDMSDERRRCLICVSKNLPCSPRTWGKERTELNQLVESRNRLAVVNIPQGSSQNHMDRLVPT